MSFTGKFARANHSFMMKKQILLFSSLFLYAISIAAPRNPDDSLQRSWNALPVFGTQTVILKEANVVYPEILKGNEAQTIGYIENFISTRKDYLIRTYQRGKRYFQKAEKILRQYNIPQEFKVLLALESGFKPNAVSKAGAYGYWQLMDKVAKEYGLKIKSNQNRYTASSRHHKSKRHSSKAKVVVDQRSDFVRSTHVAARYLKDRSRNLNNDWLLIAASYNWGVGNVWNAMAKTGKENPTYWDIEKYVPAETRSYVLNFITLNVIFNNYDKFLDNSLCFKTVSEEQPCINDEGSYSFLFGSLL